MNNKYIFPSQISAGRTHSAAWTAPAPLQRTPGVPASLQLGTPSSIPPQYTSLRECSVEGVRKRLKLLHRFSDLVYSSWRLLNLAPAQVGLWLCIWAIFSWLVLLLSLGYL
jgi:hypothetical protein